MNFATETASNAMMFAPGGGFAKGAARLGVLNPRSRYHMGIGQHRNMMQNQGSITQNKGNSAWSEHISPNATIPNGKGGYTPFDEVF